MAFNRHVCDVTGVQSYMHYIEQKSGGGGCRSCRANVMRIIAIANSNGHFFGIFISAGYLPAKSVCFIKIWKSGLFLRLLSELCMRVNINYLLVNQQNTADYPPIAVKVKGKY